MIQTAGKTWYQSKKQGYICKHCKEQDYRKFQMWTQETKMYIKYKEAEEEAKKEEE